MAINKESKNVDLVSSINNRAKNSQQWKDAPKEFGPHKTLYNRFRRWTELGVFDKIFSHLAACDGSPDTLMIDATHLKAKFIPPCIPPRRGRNQPASFSKTKYKQRHKVENMFGRLKDWRRIAMRYDRRADIFMAAITIAAIVIWCI